MPEGTGSRDFHINSPLADLSSTSKGGRKLVMRTAESTVVR
jgi:hypothetical protein